MIVKCFKVNKGWVCKFIVIMGKGLGEEDVFLVVKDYIGFVVKKVFKFYCLINCKEV